MYSMHIEEDRQASRQVGRQAGRHMLDKNGAPRPLEHQLKPIEVMKKWPLFVNKQLFWWSVSITLDNNNDVLIDF